MSRQKIEKAGTFILGGIAGAVAGLLIAPRSGRELRVAMSSRAGEARERGREGYFEARESARERLAEMREPGPVDENAAEMPLGEAFPEEPEEAEPAKDMPEDPPGPRAVAPEEVSEEEAAEDPEALRRRIQQTRERLRSRKAGDGTGG